MSTGDNSHCPCPTFLDPKGTSLLQNFINLALIDNPLDGKYIHLVNYFLKNPGKTAKEIDKAQLAEFRDYDYNTIRRHIKHLSDDLKLIEIQKKRISTIYETKTHNVLQAILEWHILYHFKLYG